MSSTARLPVTGIPATSLWILVRLMEAEDTPPVRLMHWPAARSSNPALYRFYGLVRCEGEHVPKEWGAGMQASELRRTWEAQIHIDRGSHIIAASDASSSARRTAFCISFP
ncbi:uncharacterized protein EV422DRAFT_394506 [Fimicolochytrium jonesii]|uniref:uncharacterized protein n=1 Tax=Fimicolochytrium jonesii TaxID=1396493 RepID=UPI0022FF2E91|nr:uncharacterized protein EV422DRAFT_394506 [Fimicolochytrium jonesii]KAI8823168.1 hypothetical protein EV422DRAFT_394506 [Fimicolochytrium jonesii]